MKHDEPAGGRNAEGIWSSHRTAAYPPNFNYFSAKAVISLYSKVTTTVVPTSLAPKADTVLKNDVINRATDMGVHPNNALLPTLSKPAQFPLHSLVIFLQALVSYQARDRHICQLLAHLTSSLTPHDASLISIKQPPNRVTLRPLCLNRKRRE